MSTDLLKTAVLGLAIVSGSSSADDSAELEGTVYKGNNELPKVLYITPWRRLDSQDTQQELVLHSLYGDIFDPVDPVSFELYVDYHSEQHTKGSKAK